MTDINPSTDLNFMTPTGEPALNPAASSATDSGTIPSGVYTNSDSSMSINFFPNWVSGAPQKDVSEFSLMSGAETVATVSIQIIPGMKPVDLMNEIKTQAAKKGDIISDDKAFNFTMAGNTALVGEQLKFEY